MQKSTISRVYKATTRAVSSSASRAPMQSATHSSPWTSTDKPLMRMRIRVNCAGIVQTSELSSSRQFPPSRKLLHTKAYSTPLEPLAQHASETFSPEVHSAQGEVLVAGSNGSYETVNSERRSRQADDFEVGQVSGPTNITFTKGHAE